MSDQIVTYHPLAIANYFIKHSFNTGMDLTPMKLMKLVYISHGWNLGFTSEPLISQHVEAWKYGPVISSVYKSFKEFGRNQISTMKGDVNGVYPEVKDDFTIKLLERVINVYGEMSGVKLSALTHKTDTPWDIVWNKQGGKNIPHSIINNGIINKYYKDKIEDQ